MGSNAWWGTGQQHPSGHEEKCLPISLMDHSEVRLWRWQKEARRGQGDRCRGRGVGRDAAMRTESGRFGLVRHRGRRRRTVHEQRHTEADHKKNPPMPLCMRRHHDLCGTGIGHAIIGGWDTNSGVDAVAIAEWLRNRSSPSRPVATTALMAQAW